MFHWWSLGPGWGPKDLRSRHLFFRGKWSLFGARPCRRSRAQASLAWISGDRREQAGPWASRSRWGPLSWDREAPGSPPTWSWTLPSCQLPTSQSCACPPGAFHPDTMCGPGNGRGHGFCPPKALHHHQRSPTAGAGVRKEVVSCSGIFPTNGWIYRNLSLQSKTFWGLKTLSLSFA